MGKKKKKKQIQYCEVLGFEPNNNRCPFCNSVMVSYKLNMPNNLQIPFFICQNCEKYYYQKKHYEIILKKAKQLKRELKSNIYIYDKFIVENLIKWTSTKFVKWEKISTGFFAKLKAKKEEYSLQISSNICLIIKNDFGYMLHIDNSNKLHLLNEGINKQLADNTPKPKRSVTISNRYPRTEANIKIQIDSLKILIDNNKDNWKVKKTTNNADRYRPSKVTRYFVDDKFYLEVEESQWKSTTYYLRYKNYITNDSRICQPLLNRIKIKMPPKEKPNVKTVPSIQPQKTVLLNYHHPKKKGDAETLDTKGQKVKLYIFKGYLNIPSKKIEDYNLIVYDVINNSRYTIFVAYDKVSKKIYMSYEQYLQHRNSKHRLNAKITFTNDGSEEFYSFENFQSTSLLSAYGYAVGYANGLSEGKRRKLLSYLIDSKIMKPHAIISHLQGQIRLKEKIVYKDYSWAISEWKSDIMYIEKYYGDHRDAKTKHAILQDDYYEIID